MLWIESVGLIIFWFFLTNWSYICFVFICLSGGFCSIASDWSKVFVHDAGVSLWIVVERIRLLVCGFGWMVMIKAKSICEVGYWCIVCMY